MREYQWVVLCVTSRAAVSRPGKLVSVSCCIRLFYSNRINSLNFLTISSSKNFTREMCAMNPPVSSSLGRETQSARVREKRNKHKGSRVVVRPYYHERSWKTRFKGVLPTSRILRFVMLIVNNAGRNSNGEKVFPLIVQCLLRTLPLLRTM